MLGLHRVSKAYTFTHFYESWWFWAVLVCGGIALPLYLSGARMRSLPARALELARRVDERTNELREAARVRQRAEQAADAANRA